LGGTAVALLARPAAAQAKPRVVVLGGGFAGATCARALHRADPGFEITLVEPNPTFTACPFSNSVIAGLRDIAAQRFGYDAIRSEGITVAPAEATAVDPHVRRVTLRGGSALAYDRLVLAPGIAIRWDALPGYDEAAAAVMRGGLAAALSGDDRMDLAVERRQDHRGRREDPHLHDRFCNL
jgi:NADH dehydrogenase FAD-containing subunit